MTTTATIDTTELRRLVDDEAGVRILDVRTGGEFEGMHIPGSYNVPLDTLGEHARELATVEQPLVLVCRSGARAGQAHTTLSTAGNQQLLLLDGGIDAWHAAGGEVTQGQRQTWAMDRQVRLVAGSIALTGILASVVIPQAKWLAGGVAAGLTFSALSDTCAMGNALAKLPYNRSTGCDVTTVVAALQGK